MNLTKPISPYGATPVYDSQTKSTVLLAINDARIVGGDTSWLNDISVRNNLEMSAHHLGDTKRKYEPVSVLTHYIQVGHYMANCSQLGHIPVGRRAFVGVAHDNLEDLAKFGITEDDVKQCWRGPSEDLPKISKDVLDLTDPADLTGVARLAEQKKRAENDMSMVASYARLFDKMSNYRSDLNDIQEGRLTFHSAQEAKDYRQKMHGKAAIVFALKVDDSYKNDFRALMKEIDRHILNQITAHAPIRDLFRNSKDLVVKLAAASRITRTGKIGQAFLAHMYL